MPAKAPTTVADESANNVRSISSTSPSSPTRPVRFAIDVNVPAVSRKSTNKNANATPMNPAVAITEKSNWKACEGLGTDPAIPSRSASPIIQAIIAITRIPITMAPGILRLLSTAMMMNPRPASNTGNEATSPSPTKVAGLSTMIPAFSKPMIARNSPIPAPIPSFMLFGIELMMYFRAGLTERMMNTTPATNTAVKAC